MKLAASSVDSRLVVWVKEFLLGRTQRVRVGRQLFREVKVTSCVPQGSVLGPLLFIVFVSDIWSLLADDCIIYRKIANKKGISNLQKDLDTLGEWAVENGMKINPGKSKAIRFTRARVKNPLGYSVGDHKILEASSCTYLGIIFRSDLNWVYQVNYTVHKAWKALHFVMRFVKKGNKNTKV